MLAIVETGGKQYEVMEGRYIDVELLDAEKEASFVFDKVVMIVAGDQTKVGQPYIDGATVKAKILDHAKDKKVIVYKQRCKKGYRKKQGHRQNFTRVAIENIDFPGKEAVLAALPKEEKETTAKKPVAKKTTPKTESKTSKKEVKPEVEQTVQEETQQAE